MILGEILIKMVLTECSSNMSKKDECFLTSLFNFTPTMLAQNHHNAYRHHHRCNLGSISLHFACQRMYMTLILPWIDDFGATDL